jgi:hypothetical protein
LGGVLDLEEGTPERSASREGESDQVRPPAGIRFDFIIAAMSYGVIWRTIHSPLPASGPGG